MFLTYQDLIPQLLLTCLLLVSCLSPHPDGQDIFFHLPDLSALVEIVTKHRSIQ